MYVCVWIGIPYDLSHLKQGWICLLLTSTSNKVWNLHRREDLWSSFKGNDDFLVLSCCIRNSVKPVLNIFSDALASLLMKLSVGRWHKLFHQSLSIKHPKSCSKECFRKFWLRDFLQTPAFPPDHAQRAWITTCILAEGPYVYSGCKFYKFYPFDKFWKFYMFYRCFKSN